MDPGLALLAPKPEDSAYGPKLRAWSRGTGPTIDITLDLTIDISTDVIIIIIINNIIIIIITEHTRARPPGSSS